MGHARQVGVCGLNAGAYRPGPHSGRPSVLLCGARALSVTPRVRSACPGGVERRFYSFLALCGSGGGARDHKTSQIGGATWVEKSNKVESREVTRFEVVLAPLAVSCGASWEAQIRRI